MQLARRGECAPPLQDLTFQQFNAAKAIRPSTFAWRAVAAWRRRLIRISSLYQFVSIRVYLSRRSAGEGGIGG